MWHHHIPRTIHHHNNTSPQQHIITTMHHHNNTSPQQYITRCFYRKKWLPAAMWGNLFVRRVRIYFVWHPGCPHRQHCAEVIFERLNALCCVWWFRLAVFIGMAAPTLRPGDAWRIEIAGNPMFSSIKGLPAAMRPVCATGAALLRLALGWSPLLALRGGYL